jgi:hypothetical protein
MRIGSADSLAWCRQGGRADRDLRVSCMDPELILYIGAILIYDSIYWSFTVILDAMVLLLLVTVNLCIQDDNGFVIISIYGKL